MGGFVVKWVFFLTSANYGLPKSGAGTVCRFKRGLGEERALAFFRVYWCPSAHYEQQKSLKVIITNCSAHAKMENRQ